MACVLAIYIILHSIQQPYWKIFNNHVCLLLYVSSSSANTVHGEILNHEKFRAMVMSNGGINYWTAGQLHTGCQVDITYFPFDEQACYIQLDSWTYAGDMVRIKNVSHAMNFDSYIPNGQWELFKNVTKYRIEEFVNVTYPILELEVYLRRKPLFMVMTIVLPSIILSLLVILVFYLPADAGEKLSLGITLLLSFSVFQLLLVDSLPPSSDYTPILCRYIIDKVLLLLHKVKFYWGRVQFCVDVDTSALLTRLAHHS